MIRPHLKSPCFFSLIPICHMFSVILQDSFASIPLCKTSQKLLYKLRHLKVSQCKGMGRMKFISKQPFPPKPFLPTLKEVSKIRRFQSVRRFWLSSIFFQLEPGKGAPTPALQNSLCKWDTPPQPHPIYSAGGGRDTEWDMGNVVSEQVM